MFEIIFTIIFLAGGIVSAIAITYIVFKLVDKFNDLMNGRDEKQREDLQRATRWE